MEIINLAPPLGWTLWRRLIELTTRMHAKERCPAGIDENDLADLDSRTLNDIGASPHLMARAEARLAARRDERVALRLGVASAGWRHW